MFEISLTSTMLTGHTKLRRCRIWEKKKNLKKLMLSAGVVQWLMVVRLPVVSLGSGQSSLWSVLVVVSPRSGQSQQWPVTAITKMLYGSVPSKMITWKTQWERGGIMIFKKLCLLGLFDEPVMEREWERKREGERGGERERERERARKSEGRQWKRESNLQEGRFANIERMGARIGCCNECYTTMHHCTLWSSRYQECIMCNVV